VVRAPSCEFYPGICLTIEEKARENLSQGKKNLSQVKKNLSQSTVYISPQTPTHYKALTNTHIIKPTHTLQNNIKPPQYKLKLNAVLHNPIVCLLPYLSCMKRACAVLRSPCTVKLNCQFKTM
jgi:hypothetical protein